MLHFIMMFSLFIDYSKWHYSYALLNILRLAREFVRFFFNLFSVTLFLKSLFKPIFNVPVDDVDTSFSGDMVAVFLSGILMRVFGAMIRTFFIILGVVCALCSISFFIVTFLLWVFTPVVFLLCLYFIFHFGLSTL
jgi:hypothetical protein